MANHRWLQEVRNVGAIVQASGEMLDIKNIDAETRRRVERMRDHALTRLTDLLEEDSANAVLASLPA